MPHSLAIHILLSLHASLSRCTHSPSPSFPTVSLYTFSFPFMPHCLAIHILLSLHAPLSRCTHSPFPSCLTLSLYTFSFPFMPHCLPVHILLPLHSPLSRCTCSFITYNTLKVTKCTHSSDTVFYAAGMEQQSLWRLLNIE